MNESKPQQIVVLHASDDAADVQRALDTATGLREALPAFRVRIIVNGPALHGVSGTEPVAAEGIEVAACSLGLHRRDIDTATLRPGIHTVSAAAVAIVQEQLDGAAYLRV